MHCDYETSGNEQSNKETGWPDSEWPLIPLICRVYFHSCQIPAYETLKRMEKGKRKKKVQEVLHIFRSHILH